MDGKKEHLEWAKDRALVYVERGDLLGAWASITSDLNKHPETVMHPGILVGQQLINRGDLSVDRLPPVKERAEPLDDLSWLKSVPEEPEPLSTIARRVKEFLDPRERMRYFIRGFH